MRLILIILVMCSSVSALQAADWVMWRHNAGRTAVTTEPLPDPLELQWVRELQKPRTAWPKDQDKLAFDAAYEPVVKGKTIFIPSMNSDSLSAYDTDSGEKKWTFYANGPIRFAPVLYKDRVFFVSDDGCLYCLRSNTGELIGKIKAAPDNMNIIGNHRVVSLWPARGAPVLNNDIIYFAAGVWPFMGTFIYAIHADTLETVWCNSGSGSTYTMQQHFSPAFSGVAPQGYLCVQGNTLLVSGGNTTPAAYDTRTGRFLYYKPSSRVFSSASGGYAVSVIDGYFMNNYGIFDLESGDEISKLPMGIYDGNICYQIRKSSLEAFKIEGFSVEKEERIKVGVRSMKILAQKISPEWVTSVDCEKVLLKAGHTLYGYSQSNVKAIHLDGVNSKVVWEHKLQSIPVSMIAADGKLFVSTLQGEIYCFGKERKEIHHALVKSDLLTSTQFSRQVDNMIAESGKDGYAISLGVGTGELIKELIKKSEYHIVVIEDDVKKARSFRDEMDAKCLYGSRVAVILKESSEVKLAPYMANLIFSENVGDGELNGRILNSLRPYGGTVYLPANKGTQKLINASKIENLKIELRDDFIIAKREGRLPGSGSWTHQAADSANTMVSKDTLPQTPLGLLWFGGPSNTAVLPRHGHGPAPQVINGRLFIEGKDMLRAVDVYTGRLLWERNFNNLGLYYDNTDHHHGANGIGSNFASTEDAIYVMYPDKCLVLNPENGEFINEIKMPAIDDQKDIKWGNIRVYDDFLVATAMPISVFLSGNKSLNIKLDKDSEFFPVQKYGDYAVGSQYLIVFDRKSGESLWHRKANHNFRHNSIAVANNKIFCIDNMTDLRRVQWGRESQASSDKAKLYALDVMTGKVLWQSDENVFGTWLAYSEENDILVQTGIQGRDRARDEAQGISAVRGGDGKELWFNKTGLGRIMLHHSQIIGEKDSLDIKTGKKSVWLNPVNRQLENWSYARTYGCGAPIASEHLITFRSAAAGYYDLKNKGGTGNFGGFKSGCTANLIAADGVLNAPDYTRTCKCSYQNQTSLALIHMPEAETWTANKYMGAYSFATKISEPFVVKKIGINFSAPGDRVADDGTLWINYPHDNSPSPSLNIAMNDDATYTREHSMLFTGDKKWISSSYAENLKDIEITVKNSGKFTIRLYFSEYQTDVADNRLFHVSLQGKQVLKNFNISSAAKGVRKGVMKEFKGVFVDKSLKITLEPISGETLLSGIEMILE